jgi:hypothetical protein
MNTQALPRKSSLAAATAIAKRLLIPSILLPQLVLLALPGCTVDVDPGDEPLEDVAEEPAALPSVPVMVYDATKRGKVYSTIAASGVTFTQDNYDAVIIDVSSGSTETLTPIVNQFLKDGKQVVLDSSGQPNDRLAIAELGGAVAGIKLPEAALSIVQTATDAFAVTPIVDGAASLTVDNASAGNTALAVVGGQYLPPQEGDVEAHALVGPMAATDTILRSRFQGSGKPVPAVIPVIVDNNATHLTSGFRGSNLQRYLYRGDLQRCPSNGTQVCPMSWGEQYSRTVSHGLNIGVSIQKVFEKLTGGVTLGYSLSVSTSRTLQWSTGANLNPGWTGRPVSYIWRRTGYGNVKNAYIFQSRKTQVSPCRPLADCKVHRDTYVRQPNTVVGTWSANVVLNQGSPTNTFNTFRGTTDPNVYIFDK